MIENDCRKVFSKLSEYLERELPAGTCDELNRHIQDCAPCVEFVESLKKSIALGQAYDPRAEPEAIPSEVRSALREAYRKALAAREK